MPPPFALVLFYFFALFLLCFPLRKFPLSLLALEKILYFREQDTDKGFHFMEEDFSAIVVGLSGRRFPSISTKLSGDKYLSFQGSRAGRSGRYGIDTDDFPPLAPFHFCYDTAQGHPHPGPLVLPFFEEDSAGGELTHH